MVQEVVGLRGNHRDYHLRVLWLDAGFWPISGGIECDQDAGGRDGERGGCDGEQHRIDTDGYGDEQHRIDTDGYGDEHDDMDADRYAQTDSDINHERNIESI